jgi:hypothetical protein
MSQLAYIPAHAEPHATVDAGDNGVAIVRPMIGLRRAGAVFTTTLTLLCGLAVWMLASLDPSSPLTPLGLSLVSLFVAMLCSYAWVKTIDEASRRYALFASPTGLQIHSEGLLGDRNELWRMEELIALWLANTPRERSHRCRDLVVRVKSGEIVSVLSHLEFIEPRVESMLREALGWGTDARAESAPTEASQHRSLGDDAPGDR